MNLSSTETAMEFGSYPERPGEPDCSYYIRTGLCRFGETCRYNHPPNRTLAFANAWMKGEYPERFGQPECQYYLKTGTCKFGVTCKFHHPRDKAGIAGRVALNTYGYPLRPNEAECTYYLRTGLCKFGTTCKFHHPQPNNMMLSLRGSPVYTSLHSATASGQQSYPGGITNWSRMSLVASPRWQNPSTYTPMILPQGMVSVPGYAYSGQLGSDSSPNSQRQTVGNSQIQVDVHQSNYLNGASQEMYTSYQDGSVPQDFYALPTENLFPERPGEPECLYYMKTGDCKFGSVCKFHHPRERVIPVPDCLLSPMGLPLRPGEPPCAFYSRYGICKFGPNCKFDHPMEILTNETAASSSANAPSRHIGLSARAAVLTSPSEGFDEASTNPRQFPLSDSRDIHSDGDNNE